MRITAVFLRVVGRAADAHVRHLAPCLTWSVLPKCYLPCCCLWTWEFQPNGHFLPVGRAIIALLPQLWAAWSCLWWNPPQAWCPGLTQGEYWELRWVWVGAQHLISRKEGWWGKTHGCSAWEVLSGGQLLGFPVFLSWVRGHLFTATEWFFTGWAGERILLWWPGGLQCLFWSLLIMTRIFFF